MYLARDPYLKNFFAHAQKNKGKYFCIQFRQLGKVLKCNCSRHKHVALWGLYDDLCEINIDSRNEFDILKNDRHTKTKK